MKCLEAVECGVEQALQRSSGLIARVEHTGEVWCGGSVITGPAIVLGRTQRMGGSLDLSAVHHAAVPVHRRRTAGTTFFIPSLGALWSLALPTMTSLAPDTLGTNVLNRNVRGHMNALTRAGARCQYFGREWLAFGHRPGVMVGLEFTEQGTLLLEMCAGFEASMALPSQYRSADEREVDSWRGHTPVALGELLGGSQSSAQARAFVQSVQLAAATWWKQPLEIVSGDVTVEASHGPLPSDAVDSPIEFAIEKSFRRRCPIGFVEAAKGRDHIWLGGDALMGSATLDRWTKQPQDAQFQPHVEPLLGASAEDFAWLIDAVTTGDS